MPFDPTPWVIAGGAQHSADLARTLAFAATGGKEGVITPDDLRVTASGSSVAIGPGACSIVNRFAGGGEQSYIARNAGSTLLAVPATGGTGRTDLVVVRVDDPQYPGTATPGDPANASYVRPFLVQNVPAGAADASVLNLGYPALALARLEIPAGTSTLSAAMIKDVRKVGQPRTERKMVTAYPTSVDTLGPNAPAGFSNWPSRAWQVFVPEWATRAVVHGIVAGAKGSGPDASTNADFDLQIAVLLGTQQTEAAQSEWLTILNAAGTSRTYPRQDLNCGGTLDVTSMRGQWHNLRFRAGFVVQVTANQSRISVDSRSTLIIDLEFQEAAS